LIAERSLAAAEAAGSKELATLKAEKPAEPSGFAPAMTVTRQSPDKLTREELEAVMSASAKNLPLYLGVKGDNQYSILLLTKVEEAPAPDPAQVSQLQAQLAQAWGAAEEQAALKILRQAYKVKVLPDAARVISGELDAAKL
jgi:peptidyl-prolyl cis-trans isomerase D